MKKEKRPSPDHPLDHHAKRGLSLFEDADTANRVTRRFKAQLNQKYPSSAKNRSIRSLLSIAASVLLVIGLAGAYFLQGNSQQDSWSIDGEWKVAPESPLSTATLAPSRNELVEDGQAQLGAAAVNYNKKDYEKAAQAFRGYLSKTENARPEVLLYLGHSELQYAPEQAIQTLQSFLQNSELDGYYRDLAHWYLAWAYIQIQEEEDANASLKEIQDPSSPVFQDAQQLMELLFE